MLLRNGNDYGASALVRQLIECEYLLRAFRLNFADAARWHDANDSERWDFKPSKLREVGGFDRKEYADHCEAGGHPHPRGRRLSDASCSCLGRSTTCSELSPAPRAISMLSVLCGSTSHSTATGRGGR